MKTNLFIAGVAAICALVSGCVNKINENFLGSAVVETKTVQVSTTAQGSLLATYKQEGQQASAGETLAIVDTVPLLLKLQELKANVSQLEASVASSRAQLQSSQSDVSGLQREFDRISKLVQNGSAPARDRDNLQTQFQSSQFRLESANKMLASLLDQQKGLVARIDQLNNQIKDCFVRSPSSGMVLTQYRAAGEVIGPGNPIYEIGKYDTLYADFFVPQPVLSSLKYGQQVRIRIDYQDPSSKGKQQFVPAAITWIGQEAEFSPKNIQTRESRNELVFRVRTTIPNANGMLKRGLPVEVWR
jgi:HlyD family secretion protein